MSVSRSNEKYKSHKTSLIMATITNSIVRLHTMKRPKIVFYASATCVKKHSTRLHIAANTKSIDTQTEKRGRIKVIKFSTVNYADKR